METELTCKAVDLLVCQESTINIWNVLSTFLALFALVLSIFLALKNRRTMHDEIFAEVHAWVKFEEQAGSNQRAMLIIDNQTKFPIREWRVKITWQSHETVYEEFWGSEDSAGILEPKSTQKIPFKKNDSLPQKDSMFITTINFVDGLKRQLKRDDVGRLAKSKF